MKVVKTLLVAACVCFGINMASAQQPSIPNADDKSKTRVLSFDEDKADAYNNPALTLTDAYQIAKYNLIQQKRQERATAEGYLPIPGFTFTGIPSVDQETYGKLMHELKTKQPALYDAIQQGL